MHNRDSDSTTENLHPDMEREAVRHKVPSGKEFRSISPLLYCRNRTRRVTFRNALSHSLTESMAPTGSASLENISPIRVRGLREQDSFSISAMSQSSFIVLSKFNQLEYF